MKELTQQYNGFELCSGTLNTNDLIINFMTFLRLVKKKCEIVEQVNSLTNKLASTKNDKVERESILWEDIFYLLNWIAPANCHFSCHQGNGSQFGFWETED